MRRFLGLFLLLLTFCGGPSPGRPPVIRYGEDACDECKMLISESRFAAAYTAAEGTFRFDDLGCLLLHYRKQGRKAYAIWVHDYETGEWIRGEQAYFVAGSKTHTPMAYGIVAFADSSRAQDFTAREGGKLMKWRGLLQSWRPERSPGMMWMKGGHHDAE